MSRLAKYQHGLTGHERVRVACAVLLAGVAASIGWLGLFWRTGSLSLHGAVARLGAHDYIHIAIPFILSIVLLAAAWLVRGVVLVRLQIAIIISLFVHLLLLFLLQLLPLPSVLAQAIEPADLEGAQEILLPDYGGMEAPDAEPERWQTDVAVTTPERQLEEETRQTLEMDQPTRPERQEELPQNRVEMPQLQPNQVERTPDQMPDRPLEISRQSLEQPVAPQADAQAPELTDTRPSEKPLNDSSADIARQSASADSLNKDASAEQLPELSRRDAMDQPANRAEMAPSVTDPAAMAAARQSQAPVPAEPTIEATAPTAQPARTEYSPTESETAPARAPAQLAQRADSPSPTRLGQMRSSAANVAAARSDAPPDLAGGANSANIARAGSAGRVQGADGQIDAPEVSSGAAVVQSPSLEPGRAGVTRSAAGRITGPSGTASSPTANSAPLTAGSGTTPALDRVATRDAVGSPSGVGGTGAAIARGSVGGGIRGATGTGESVQVAESPPGSTAGQSGIGAAPGATELGRAVPGPAAVRAGPGSGAVRGLSPTRLGSGAGPSSSAGDPRGRAGGDALEPRLAANSAGGGRTPATLPGRSASPAIQGVSGGIEGEATALTPGPQPGGGGLTPGPEPSGGRSGPGQPGSGSPTGRSGIARQAARLPGGAPAGNDSSPAGALASAATVSIGAPTRRGQNETPELHPLVSKLARQMPNDRRAGLAEISPAFSLRTGEMRKEAARTLGGTPETERAVEMGIAWLAQHQAPDGSWGVHDFHKQCKGHQCDGPGSFDSPTAGTGLALIAFLGAGYTHQSGQYKDTVARGLKWLVDRQRSDGDLFASEVQFVRYYSHGIAAIALCEAYGMTKDPTLREPTQKALQFILDSQHPQLGGWRYQARTESDTSVSGWQLMALKSGEMAGFSVPATAYQSVTRWLDSVERGAAGGLYAYHPTRPESLAMTAEGLLMRQYLGFSRENPRLRAGANFLNQHLPDLAQRDAYYWYYATQMMYHMQGSHWENWNGRLRDLITELQSKEGGTYGSWSPSEPTGDRWGDAGGRLYVTCMHLLILEVYYRHLPLYQQLER